MARGKRRAARDLGVREAGAIAATLAREIRTTRRRRRLTQAALADRVGLSQAEISNLEAGRGARTTIETWVAIGIALDRPIAMSFSRDAVEPLQDAGHLAAQEILIRLATAAGWSARFEVPSRPDQPRHATDVALVRGNGLVLAEVWNRLDDLGAAVRSTDRKLVEAGPPRPSSCWLFVDTVANRAIVRRFQAILRARFPGSSAGWVAAIAGNNAPPGAAGIVWIDVRAARLRAIRLAA
jgi:transcriptional regulator with XRE-family HTH domain